MICFVIIELTCLNISPETPSYMALIKWNIIKIIYDTIDTWNTFNSGAPSKLSSPLKCIVNEYSIYAFLQPFAIGALTLCLIGMSTLLMGLNVMFFYKNICSIKKWFEYYVFFYDTGMNVNRMQLNTCNVLPWVVAVLLTHRTWSTSDWS